MKIWCQQPEVCPALRQSLPGSSATTPHPFNNALGHHVELQSQVWPLQSHGGPTNLGQGGESWRTVLQKQTSPRIAAKYSSSPATLNWNPFHRITGCSGLEGPSVGHPIQPPAEAGSPTAGERKAEESPARPHPPLNALRSQNKSAHEADIS